MSLDGSSSVGLRSFKTFLDYAETRNLVASEATGADTDSPFEDSVYEFLRDNGYEVRTQVGCAGFRVDLGVVDAREPGRYLVGIECDGAKYHSSPVARDRDRLRQQILEGLGWQIYRIWSTDWYRNRTETKDRLLRALEEAKLRAPSKKTESVKANHVPPPEIETTSFDNVISDGALDSLAPEYDACTVLCISTHESIHQTDPNELANAIEDVVKIEGPVHVDEVVRRIRTLWGVKRAGARIQNAIEMGINIAKSRQTIVNYGDFLWNQGQRMEKARRRIKDPSPQLDLICKEEIKVAIRMVLEHQFASPQNDLASQAARILGFNRVTENTSSDILKIIQEMLKKGDLEIQANGNVHIAE